MKMNTKEISPYDVWKAKADLVDFYRTDYEKLQVVNQLLLTGLGFCVVVISILAWFICKYL
jgi:hypothetical protein